MADADDVDADQATVGRWVNMQIGKDSDLHNDYDWLKVDNVWRFQRPDPQYGVEGYDGRA